MRRDERKRWLPCGETPAPYDGLAVDLFTVARADDVNGSYGRIHVVDDAEITDAQRIAAVFRTLQGFARVGLMGE